MSVENVSSFIALSGAEYTAKDGVTIERREEDSCIYTEVFDANGKIIYTEKDSPISDSSKTFYYNPNANDKLDYSITTWYECGAGYGRSDSHNDSTLQTITSYDEQGRPITDTAYFNFGNNHSVTTTRYEHSENGDYLKYIDWNNNGKMDENENPEHFIFEATGDHTQWKDDDNNGKIDEFESVNHFDSEGKYLTEEEFINRNPQSKIFNSQSTNNDGFFDKVINWFKGLFE